MFLCVLFKVFKYGFFYFKFDSIISIVFFSKIVKVINGDNVSKGSKVMLKYGNLILEVEIIGVYGKWVDLLY